VDVTAGAPGRSAWPGSAAWSGRDAALVRLGQVTRELGANCAEVREEADAHEFHTLIDIDDDRTGGMRLLVNRDGAFGGRK
jgi:hypothetical protein